LNIVEPDRHEKYKKNANNQKFTEDNLISESSDNAITNKQKNDLDWSKIKINTVENNIIVSKDDFKSIVNHINNLELLIDETSYYVENNDGDNVLDTDTIDDGINLFHFIF